MDGRLIALAEEEPGGATVGADPVRIVFGQLKDRRDVEQELGGGAVRDGGSGFGER